MDKKQDFFTYYESLSREERAELRKVICERLRITEMTFYNWYKRRAIPRWHTATIADLIGASENELFPNRVRIPEFRKTTAAPAATIQTY